MPRPLAEAVRAELKTKRVIARTADASSGYSQPGRQPAIDGDFIWDVGAPVDRRQAAPLRSALSSAIGIRIKRGTKSRRLRRSRPNKHDAANLPRRSVKTMRICAARTAMRF